MLSIFYCPYLVVSQIESYSFLNRHRTDMRRSHLCGQGFQGVAILCQVLIELRWCVSTLWKTDNSTERFLGTDAAANAAQWMWLLPGIWGTLQRPWNLRYPPECLEVDDKCVSLGPECLNAGARAKNGLCTLTFLLRVRLEHGCTEWDPQELETNISNKTHMQVNNRERYSLESLMPPLISCAWAVILAAHWISETTVYTSY